MTVGVPGLHLLQLARHGSPRSALVFAVLSWSSGYSIVCYSLRMGDRSEVLRRIMKETDTSQSQLARLSGVHQPSISQFLSARVDFSDDQLDRLLSCMGYRLEISRHAIAPELKRAEWRSWKLHCQLSTHLTRSSLTRWRPTIVANLDLLRRGVRGQPHLRNIERWEALVNHRDVAGLHRVLTGLDRDSIEMREVSPMSGLLSDEDRTKVLEALD